MDYFLDFLEIQDSQKMDIKRDLEGMGERVPAYHKHAIDSERNKPKLIKYNAYGEQINEITTSEGWKNLKKISVEESIIPDAYHQEQA